MKICTSLLFIMLSYLIFSCNNKITSIKLEKNSVIPNNLKPYLLDYTYSDGAGNKDTLIISSPIRFSLINNSKNIFFYEFVKQTNDRYNTNVVINQKRYFGGNIRKKIYINPNEKSEITYYFQTPISKEELEKDPKTKLLLNDEKLGDSITINILSTEMKKSIDYNLSKLSFIVDLKNERSKKRVGIWYCFNKNKAIVYDIDSLNKANPRYMFSCDKDFY